MVLGSVKRVGGGDGGCCCVTIGSRINSDGGDRDRVRDASDIVQIVGEHVSLKPKGREFVGLCPFHDDHSPSMYVVPQKQIYHCFSCGAGGDVFRFVQDFHKMSFREALEYLAQRGGVSLSERRGGVGFGGVHVGGGGGLGRVSGGEVVGPNGEVESEAGWEYGDDAGVRAGGSWGRQVGGGGRDSGALRESLLRANRQAMDFFRLIYRHSEYGAAARSVVERRGISGAMVESFGLGASPARWDGLLETIRGKGFDESAFGLAGLLKRRESGGGMYDAFRNRLMFPIHDQLGRVVAFGARRLDEADEPKYLNSAESAVFNKSRTLYGLHHAAQAIRKSGVAIVTEGYMDTIACHQAGVVNAVATLGTALTPESARVLSRLCATVVLLFDGDDAGRKAADRAVEVFFSLPVDVKIAVLTSKNGGGAKDPDELLRMPGGRGMFDSLIDGARDALDVRCDGLASRLRPMGVAGRARLIDEELAALARLGLDRLDPVKRETVLVRVARLAGVDERTIKDAARRHASKVRPMVGGGAGVGGAGGVGGVGSGRRGEPRGHAEQLAACLLACPELAGGVGGGDDAAALLAGCEHEDAAAGRVVGVVVEMLRVGEVPEMSAVLAALGDDEEAGRVAASFERWIVRRIGDDPVDVESHWRSVASQAVSRRAELSISRGAVGGGGAGDGGGGEEGAEDAAAAAAARVRMRSELNAKLGGGVRARVPRTSAGPGV